MHNFFLENKKYFIFISVIVFLGMLSLYFFYNPSQHSFFPKCIFHQATGLHCPGCGSQRAIHKILQGDFIEGLKHNILIFLLIIVIAYQITIYGLNHFMNKNHTNLLHRSMVTKIILILVISYWILRNIDIYPFTILAP